MQGKEYIPLYTYFESMKDRNCFTVITADFVTSDTGTGIVHMAPGFGEDDYNACVAHKLIDSGKAPVPVDFDGKFTELISDFAGKYIKDADNDIKENLK